MQRNPADGGLHCQWHRLCVSVIGHIESTTAFASDLGVGSPGVIPQQYPKISVTGLKVPVAQPLPAANLVDGRLLVGAVAR